MRGNGLAKHTEAKMMKPASIKQNKKKRMRKLITVFLPTTNRGSGVVLGESCSSPFCRRVAVCDSDVEIGFMMRAAYDNNRKVECPSYTFLEITSERPVLERYGHRDHQKGSSFLRLSCDSLIPRVVVLW